MKIGMVGIGLMGHGIAHGTAAAGYTTRLYDVSDTQLAKARGQIEAIVKKKPYDSVGLNNLAWGYQQKGDDRDERDDQQQPTNGIQTHGDPPGEPDACSRAIVEGGGGPTNRPGGRRYKFRADGPVALPRGATPAMPAVPSRNLWLPSCQR